MNRPLPGAHLHGLEADPDRGAEIDKKSPGERARAESRHFTRRRRIGLLVGAALAVLVYVALPDDLSHPGKLTAATAVLMGAWWMTEAIPIPATALMPLIIFPAVGRQVTVSEVGASYGADIIFLFMGGFLIALAMQRWNLHRRMALLTVRLMGTKSTNVIAGFMLATAFLSMWVSNTATAVMMLPIGVSVLLLVAEQSSEGTVTTADGPTADGPTADGPTADGPTGRPTKAEVTKTNFGTALMLGIAYSASLGSLATIIGTPPNTLLVGYLRENFDINIGFGQWMMVGLPLAIVFNVIAWFVLSKVLFKPEIERIPGGRQLMDNELAKLGPVSRGELRVLVIFVLAALAWVSLPLIMDKPPLSDAGIAVIAGVLLFLLPAGANRGVRLLDWDTATTLPWGVLLLFGGGLALSAQFTKSGLSTWIGARVSSWTGVSTILLIVLFTIGILLLTEMTSNTATAATFLPVAGGVAIGVGAHPMLLAVPVALAATCAFMLPVATPPNAIAYGSGYVTSAQMLKGGVWLNLVGIVLIPIVTLTLLAWVFQLTA
ncbi:MAG: DASS family sodium-coupled anion symporter [Dermatophilaceae bacterium]